MAELYNMLKKHAIPRPALRVDSKMVADVWFEPAVVIEVTGAEITLSPTHTCAKGLIPQHKESGLAIRFPRFTGNYRLDKSPEEATKSVEVKELYYTLLRTANKNKVLIP